MINVWKAYRPGSWILKGVNMRVDEGEFVVIVGPNGSGKTTIVKMLAGLLRPSKGVVKVCGREAWTTEAKKCRNVVMHWSFLYDELTVEENLSFYSALLGLSSTNPPETLVPREKLSHPAGWLSFGWRRRADIARALLGKPKLLIVDEPFTGLDSKAVALLMEELIKFVKHGGTIIATTPKGEKELVTAASKVYTLTEGRLVELKPEAEDVYGYEEVVSP